MIQEKPIDWLAYCPLNIQAFDALNRQLPQADATLLLSKILFHQRYSKIHAEGRQWVVRSREQMAHWLDCSLSKIDRLLGVLEEGGFLLKKRSLWYGKQRLFLSATSTLHAVPINFAKLSQLAEKTGSRQSALIFSRILYSFSNSSLRHAGQVWCALSKSALSEFSGLSIRTVDAVLDHLMQQGFIEKNVFVWQGKRQCHFRVLESALPVLKKLYQSAKALVASSKACRHICRSQPANMTTSIIERTKEKETNNITRKYFSSLLERKQKKDAGGISFEDLGGKGRLSARQKAYLRGAFNNTQQRNGLCLSSPEQVWEELLFSLSSPSHSQAVSNFRHGVSRAMLLLSQGRWRTPFGFSKHSAAGQQYAALSRKNAKQHFQYKRDCGARDLKGLHRPHMDSTPPKKSSEEMPRQVFQSLKSVEYSWTKKGVRFAEALFSVSKNADLGREEQSRRIHFLEQSIHACLRKGADRKIIFSALPDTPHR